MSANNVGTEVVELDVWLALTAVSFGVANTQCYFELVRRCAADHTSCWLNMLLPMMYLFAGITSVDHDILGSAIFNRSFRTIAGGLLFAGTILGAEHDSERVLTSWGHSSSSTNP